MAPPRECEPLRSQFCESCGPECRSPRSETAPWPAPPLVEGAPSAERWEQVTPGTLTPLQYDQAVGDLVNYLQWMGEPAQNKRVGIGVWVMLFLLLFTLMAWRLNAAYWKDVK